MPLGLPGPLGVPLERIRTPWEATSLRKASKVRALRLQPPWPQIRTGRRRDGGGEVGA